MKTLLQAVREGEGIYQDNELDRDTTNKKFLLVRTEGTRQVKGNIDHYNLDPIIAAGYRGQSQIATRFRRWQRIMNTFRKALQWMMREGNTDMDSDGWCEDDNLCKTEQLGMVFRFAESEYRIPVVYQCGREIILDMCRCVKAEEVERFLEKWENNIDGTRDNLEMRFSMELENPLERGGAV